MKKFFTLLLSILLFSNYLILDSNAESLKKSTEIRCKNFYEKFKNLGEESLRKRYPAHPTLDTCLKLFNSTSWTFSGKNLIDEKYLSYLSTTNSKSQSNSNIIFKMKIGQDQYLIKFSVCVENKQNSKYLLITTDTEQFFGKIPRPLNNQCGAFWEQILSKNPESFQFVWNIDSIPTSKMIRKLL